jgi:uncharacterized protein YciI
MFYLIVSRYIRPVSELDAAMDEHVLFLEKQFSKGVFVLSGPKTPRSGGIILARSDSLENLLEVIEADPFRRLGLIDYEVTAWVINRRLEQLTQDVFCDTKGYA